MPVADDLLALALAVVERAGDLLLDELGRRRTLVGTKTTGTDMVTDVDRASEALITAELLAARPDDGIVAEEGTARVGTSGVQWVVDPLDGTTNYLYGLPGFAVSVAAEDRHGGLVGVVLDPLHGDTFAARRGHGATRNGVPIRCNAHADLATALVATGFSYERGRRERQAAVLREVLPRVRDIRRQGAAAVDLCWVACGRVDAFYERGLQPWDHAAGGLVAREAGAVTCDLEGGPPSTAFTLAAGPDLVEPLRALLTAAGADAA